MTLLKRGMVIIGVIFTSILLYKDLYYYTWEEKHETIIYSIPMVFIFFYWLRSRLEEAHIFQYPLLLCDIAVVSLAAVRIIGLLFHSGHVLFLLYSLATTKNKTYSWISGLMLGFTLFLKFCYWHDFITPVLGGGLACLFIWIRKRYLTHYT